MGVAEEEAGLEAAGPFARLTGEVTMKRSKMHSGSQVHPKSDGLTRCG